MIMRIFQVVTKPGKEKEFGEFFHQTAIPLMRKTDGIIQVLPGASRADSPPRVQFRNGLERLGSAQTLCWRRLPEFPYRSY
jgi:hypothetical protein